MRNKEEIRLQRVVMALCAILFAVFSFLFIAEYQTPLLELFYKKVATGKLQYNAYIVGAVISIALTIFALWLNKFAGFKREWTSFSFLPSALILAFITDIDRSLYTGEYDYLKWIIVFSIGTLAYATFSFVLRRMLFAKIKNIAMSANRIIWRNLVLFVIMFSLIGLLSNGEEHFKREALVAHHYSKGETDKALNVGYLSNAASQTLTVQRAYILAKEGLLGDKLFEYPQLYGKAGLLPKTEQISPLVPDSVFAMLGVTPLDNEDVADVLKRAINSEFVTDVAKNYYLSALLLERNIIEFVDAVGKLYPDIDKNRLPKHYQEALILYSSIEKDFAFIDNPAMQERFRAFKNLEDEYDDIFIRANYVRRKFGRTYWWYYLYGSI